MRNEGKTMKSRLQFFLACLVACGPLSAQTPRTLEPARPAAKQAAQDTDNSTCQVEPHVVTEVGSSVDGVIEKVLVNRGDLVAAGQVVAKLRSGVEEAEVAVKRAKVELGKR